MITAKWREGYGFYKDVDPNKVAQEIRGIGEEATSQQIVDRARDENSELHKCFEWDDSIAAEQYRIQQARYVVHHLVIKEEVVPKDRPEVRYFVKPKQSEGYKQTQFVMKIDTEYEALLKQAWAELQAFKRKYSMLKELQEIFDLIQ